MKVLHSLATRTPSSGIVNQMAWEQESADRLSLDWDTRIFLPGRGAVDPRSLQQSGWRASEGNRAFGRKLIDWKKLRDDYYGSLLRLQDEYDVFLLRYSLHDPFQRAFVRAARIPVFTVHHTLELPELVSYGTPVYRVRAVAERLIGNATLPHVSGIIGVTREIVDYELSRSAYADLSSAVYPNGILYSDGTVADKRGEVPELLFLASNFRPWQGLDVLLSELEKSPEKLVLNLVGNLRQEVRLRASRDSRIKFHGHLSAEQVRQLAAGCSLALAPLALHRKHMREACTLKVREYLMMGLPVYSGHADVFPAEFPYYRQGPVDIGAMLEFSRAHAPVGRETISTAARPHIEKERLLGELARFLGDQLGTA